jgi:hypothetical protein
MNYLRFHWSEPTALSAELMKPIAQISVQLDTHGRPMNATLWRTDGTGLRIQAEMHDVAERREVGILKFNYASFPSEDEKIVDVRSRFGPKLVVSKVIIDESGTSAESGIVIKSMAGHEILIVVAAMPYFLAVTGNLKGPHVFEPEYPVKCYKNVPITMADSFDL